LTDLHLELDPAPLLNRPLVLFRLADERYADLSGIGSKISGARWNPRGQEAIYTSIDTSLPILEHRVNVPEGSPIPSNLVMMRILIEGEWETLDGSNQDVWDVSDLAGVLRSVTKPARMVYFRSLAEAEKAYQQKKSFGAPIQGVESGPYDQLNAPFAVALPSVVSPSWNVVLFPMAAGFADHVRLDATQRYEYDERLFPTGTPRQSRRL
jgi:RES domain-containing protein